MSDKEIYDFETAIMGLQSIAGLSSDDVAKGIAREVINVMFAMNAVIEGKDE